MQLVQQRTLNILSVEGILARQINVHLNAEQVCHLDIEAVTKLQLLAHTEGALMANLAVLCALHAQIDAIETSIHRKVKLHPEFEILKTAPNIGNILAATIMLETGAVSRFPGVGDLSSYCRCEPGDFQLKPGRNLG